MKMSMCRVENVSQYANIHSPFNKTADARLDYNIYIKTRLCPDFNTRVYNGPIHNKDVANHVSL